jgi:hypothetical protein
LTNNWIRFLALFSQIVILTLVFSNCDNRGFSDLSNFTKDDASLNENSEGLQLKTSFVNCVRRSYNDFNQTARADGKRVGPTDCQVVRLSNPILTWAQTSDRDPRKQFVIRVTRLEGGFDEKFYRDHPRLLIFSKLQAGTYEWKVTYDKKNNLGLVTSQGRRFIIPDGDWLRIPPGSEFARIVAAKPHPRARPSGVSFKHIADLANIEYRESFADFMKQADIIAASAIADLPAKKTLADFAGAANPQQELDKWKLELRTAAMRFVGEIKILGYAFHFTGKYYYQNKALARLARLADIPAGPDDSTSNAQQDQVNREILLGLAIGLDLFHDALTSTTYLSLQKKVLARFKERVSQIDFPSFDVFPRDSHLLTAARYVLEALMYAVDTPHFPEGREMLAKQWELWITTLGSWGENYDGGFGNSDNYGWLSILGAAEGMAVVRLVANVDLTRWDLLGRLGDFVIAMTTPTTSPSAKIRQNFGDGAETDNNYQEYSKYIRMLANLTGKASYDGFWRVDNDNIYYTLALPIEHYLVLGLLRNLPQKPTQAPVLPKSYLFFEAGIAAMHSETLDPSRTSVFFRSSDFGSFSHNHADNNSFTMNSKGRPLFISAGYFNGVFQGTPHHSYVTRTTVFKNALTFDGGIGQAERTRDGNPKVPGIPLDSLEARGRIVNFSDNGTWAVVTGDATMAYRGFDPTDKNSDWRPYLTGAFRTVAYNRKEGVVIVYDYATSKTPRNWEVNFHSLNIPSWDGSSLVVSNGPARACLEMHGPAFKFHFTDQWPVLPMRYSYKVNVPSNRGNPDGPEDWSRYAGKSLSVAGKPNQSHSTFYTPNKTQEFTAVTVIREDCRNIPIQVDIHGSNAYIRVNNGQAMITDAKVVKFP